MFENPSAGKFDPPPPPKDASTGRFHPKRLSAFLLLALVFPYVLKWEKGFDHPTAKVAIDAAMFAVTTGLHFIFNRSRRDGTDDPYTAPTRVTR